MTIQQLKSLAAQLERAPQHDYTGFALYEHKDGRYELVKLTWYNRIVRYFTPQRYDVLQHLPKISNLACTLLKKEESGIDFVKLTGNLERLLFRHIRDNEKVLARSSNVQEQANAAIQGLLALRDRYLPDQLQRSILSRMKALVKNPCDKPEEFFTLTRDMKQGELELLLDSKEVKDIAEKLCKILFKKLSGQEALVGNVKISPKDLVQKSSGVTLQDPKLQRWTSFVPNYQAVCNTLNRMVLSSVQINGQVLDNSLAKEEILKVPAVCEALLRQARKIAPKLSEEALCPMVGEMVGMIAIELPNPISMPAYMLSLHNTLSKEMHLHMHGENMSGKEIAIEFMFDLKAESGKLRSTYTTQRGYSLVRMSSDSPGWVIPLRDVVYTSKVEKSFVKPASVWTGLLGTLSPQVTSDP